MEGTVKFFNPKKGYGFITGEDGKDYFVHITALVNKNWTKMIKVSFEVSQGERGELAVNVQKHE